MGPETRPCPRPTVRRVGNVGAGGPRPAVVTAVDPAPGGGVASATTCRSAPGTATCCVSGAPPPCGAVRALTPVSGQPSERGRRTSDPDPDPESCECSSSQAAYVPRRRPRSGPRRPTPGHLSLRHPGRGASVSPVNSDVLVSALGGTGVGWWWAGQGRR